MNRKVNRFSFYVPFGYSMANFGLLLREQTLDPKVNWDLITRLGLEARPGDQWGLNPKRNSGLMP